MPTSFKTKLSNYILFLIRTLHHHNNLLGQDLVTVKLCTLNIQKIKVKHVLSCKRFYKSKYKGQSVKISLITTSLVNILFMYSISFHFSLSLYRYSLISTQMQRVRKVMTYLKELSQYVPESINGSDDNLCQSLDTLFTHPCQVIIYDTNPKHRKTRMLAYTCG